MLHTNLPVPTHQRVTSFLLELIFFILFLLTPKRWLVMDNRRSPRSRWARRLYQCGLYHAQRAMGKTYRKVSHGEI